MSIQCTSIYITVPTLYWLQFTSPRWLPSKYNSSHYSNYLFLCFPPINYHFTHFKQLYNSNKLKGQCHEIFDCWFFQQMATLRPIRGTLGQFCFWLNIHRDIRQKVSSAVYDTPQKDDSAVYDTPRNGDSTVYLTLRSCTITFFLKFLGKW